VNGGVYLDSTTRKDTSLRCEKEKKGGHRGKREVQKEKRGRVHSKTVTGREWDPHPQKGPGRLQNECEATGA